MLLGVINMMPLRSHCFLSPSLPSTHSQELKTLIS